MSQYTLSGGYLEGLRNAMLESRARTEGAEFERIAAWLANLRLLNGVPWWYLVPDGRMLPSESIRFFQIDQNWIDCLIDGAFSIGRSTSSDSRRDGRVMDEVLRRVAERARELRDQKFGGPHPVEEGRASGFAATGFLLRSSLVSGWPGMNVRGKAGGKHARKVRLETVAPTILFGLFDCQVDEVTFTEPIEILHFGFDEPQNGMVQYTKQLRYISSANPAVPPGTLMDSNNCVLVPTGSNRVVDISRFAENVQSELIFTGGMTNTDTYTPAEFALELVEGVLHVTYALGGTQ